MNCTGLGFSGLVGELGLTFNSLSCKPVTRSNSEVIFRCTVMATDGGENVVAFGDGATIDAAIANAFSNATSGEWRKSKF